MKTIINEKINCIEIKKSKFITILKKVDNKEDATKILNEIRNKYKSATHYCYGVIINNYIKSSDDNEPNNTAGIQIINALQSNELNHVLGIIIRYFGGIKLGLGGLTRAYRKSIIEGIKLCQTKELIKGQQIKIITDYNKQEIIKNILKDDIIDIKYLDYIIITANCSNDSLNNLKNINVDFEIIKDILI